MLPSLIRLAPLSPRGERGNYHAPVDLGIDGKIALVTAGTKGIGLGIAHALAAEGVRVAVAARTEADVKRTAQSLGGHLQFRLATAGDGQRVGGNSHTKIGSGFDRWRDGEPVNERRPAAGAERRA